MERNAHITGTLLTRYAIHLEDPEHTDCDGEALVFEQVKEIERHLRQCDECASEVERLRQDFREAVHLAEEAGLGRMLTDGTLERVPTAARKRVVWRLPALGAGSAFRRFAVAAVLACVLLTPVGYFFLTRHPYAALAHISAPSESFTVRGGQTSQLSQGLSALQERAYQRAVRLLEQVASEEGPASAVGHFYAGMAHLLLAQKTLLGQPYGFDALEASQAIQHLEAAAEETRNRRYLEDIHWYLGKAYLMLEMPNVAAAELRQVVEFHGRRQEAAQHLLDALSHKNP